MPFSIASNSSGFGFTSLLNERRATSIAMTGAMPLAKPITAPETHLMYVISEVPFDSMPTIMGLRKPYETRIPMNVPTSAAAT